MFLPYDMSIEIHKEKKMLKKIQLILLIILVLLLGWSSGLSAAQTETISQKIQQLKTVPKAQRYKLINQIKREMIKLNAAQRSAALGELRAGMHGKGKGKGKMQQQHLQNPNCQNKERKRDGTGPRNGHKKGEGKQHQGPQKR
jgi:hypothetical protein